MPSYIPLTATLYVVIDFWSMAYDLAVAAAGTPADAGADGTMIAVSGVGLSVLLIPAALVTVAMVSRRPTGRSRTSTAWVCLSLAVGLPLLIFGNPLTSLIGATRPPPSSPCRCPRA